VFLLYAALHVILAKQHDGTYSPPVIPAPSPYDGTVIAAGVVEAETENIEVGSSLPGVVLEVMAKVGSEVHAGTPLFRLDDRQLQAELKLRHANLAVAQAQLARLESMPRTEELPVYEARAREAKASLVEKEDRLNRTEALFSRNAVSNSERVHCRQAYEMAAERLAVANAEVDLLKAGAWQEDKQVARAKVAQAKVLVEQTEADLDRLSVRALIDGEVLQVNVRPGEFVATPPRQPLIVLGNIRQLHVRVDIDESDIPHFQPGSGARATLRGQPRHSFPLTYIRVNPFVVPKRSLTGDNQERIDTRVLQVIYALDATDASVYVGQQLDVFIETT
jgi:multidrug resistance efflux pump